MELRIEVKRVSEIIKHPNADKLEIVKLENSAYEIVSRKGTFHVGELGLFIPEGSLLPPWLIEESGLQNMLGGKEKNRVRVSRVRGHLSHGFLKPLVDGKISKPSEEGREEVLAEEGVNYADWFGIVKYIPPVPTRMAGDVKKLNDARFPFFDVENFQKDLSLVEGKVLDIVEKLHGTCCLNMFYEGNVYTSSKGNSHKNLYFTDENTVYRRVSDPLQVKLGKIGRSILDMLGVRKANFCFLGEVIGPIQDLKYGEKNPKLVLFDFIYEDQVWKRIPYPLLVEQSAKENVPTAPWLDRVQYESPDQIAALSRGRSIQANSLHMREGIVLRDAFPDVKCHPPILGLMVKAVSDEYHTRNKGTEYN